jgi:hypothetical protein
VRPLPPAVCRCCRWSCKNKTAKAQGKLNTQGCAALPEPNASVILTHPTKCAAATCCWTTCRILLRVVRTKKISKLLEFMVPIKPCIALFLFTIVPTVSAERIQPPPDDDELLSLRDCQ